MEVCSLSVLNSPLLESVSVSVSSSVSPVRLFVTRTTTVSVSDAFVFASVSRIVVGSDAPGSIVVGNVPEEAVSGQTTVMTPEVTESVGVCVSA